MWASSRASSFAGMPVCDTCTICIILCICILYIYTCDMGLSWATAFQLFWYDIAVVATRTGDTDIWLRRWVFSVSAHTDNWKNWRYVGELNISPLSPSLFLPLSPRVAPVHVSASTYDAGPSTMSHSQRMAHGSLSVTRKEVKPFASIMICLKKGSHQLVQNLDVFLVSMSLVVLRPRSNLMSLVVLRPRSNHQPTT